MAFCSLRVWVADETFRFKLAYRSPPFRDKDRHYDEIEYTIDRSP